jgi:hypothetical protein
MMRGRRAAIALAPLSLAILGWLGVTSLRSESGVWSPPEEAGLPEAFPAPSSPGEIVVKFYPSVRGAFVHSDGALSDAASRAFRPLFRHIRRAGVPMTAPVVAGYPVTVADQDRGLATVAFLYPDQRTGSIGSDGEVTVADFRPLVVVSIGVLGRYDTETMRAAMRDLDSWLDENSQTWQRDGEVRRLMYERPSWLKGSRLYSEVQIPIRPASMR